jgi:protein TonB
MSAAVNDRPQDAFLPHTHLPLTGELHPLRREFERWLAAGNAIAVASAVLACTVIYFWPRPAPVDIGGLPVDIPGVVTQSPRPVVPGPNNVGFQAITPNVDKGNFEPVDDAGIKDDHAPIPGNGGDGEPGTEGSVDGPYTGDGDITINPSTPNPAEAYTWFDSEPVLLSINPPVYPEMVREAGIDGTVLVRVLVGLNGRVKDAMVVEGASPLHEAALASARTALFKPALQGTHPVEVWVVIPITFQLHGRF